ncbi:MULTISPECIES: amidohydrolase family protein [unclassified Variovorax]|uniref:amidohydrolase family protein n=1 Tax=unclassified Variovorax TaxID=663243 RepID=UPI001BD431FD|nr:MULTISPECIES: amidohydrolase family protein [unclassified Variovorax]
MATLGLQATAATALKTVVDKGLVIEGVTVVNVKDGSLSPEMSVVIENGKIARIARASAIVARGEAHAVDARGKFIVPGYLDMHAHPLNAPDPRPALKLMLSNGVTGYRQMSSSPELLQARRDGKLAYPQAPELLALPGTILTDSLTPTPDAAVAEVRKQKQQGADFIKTVGLSAKNFYAAGAEAKAQGLPYSGHMNMDINVREGAKTMRSIEHLGPLEVMLLGCSRDEAPIRDFVQHTHGEPPQVGPTTPAMQAMLVRIIANPMMMTKPPQFESMQRVLDSYDEGKCKELAGELIKDNSWQVPTLIRLRTMEIADDPAYKADPNNRFMPPPVRQMWSELGAQFPQRVSAGNREIFKRFFTLQLRFTKLLQDAGVPMLAGSDTGGSIWVVPGFSLHQDFDLFAQAGLSPLQVLQIATINGAKYLGRESTMGTVEAGKNADLVLLDANPVADVANLHRIAGVVRAGGWYSPAALHKLQAEALP